MEKEMNTQESEEKDLQTSDENRNEEITNETKQVSENIDETAVETEIDEKISVEESKSGENKTDNGENVKDDDKIEIVAIPFINDGENNVQLFYNSMFCKDEDSDAIIVAERYFFECFRNDDLPKWDGVYVCQYNFSKNGIIKDDRNGFVRVRDFKSKWLWNSSGAMEDVTFNVKCTMPKVWASHFQSFLKEMERYGQIGHSGQISFMSNGGGNFKPRFKFTKEYDSVQGIQSVHILKKAEQLFSAE